MPICEGTTKKGDRCRKKVGKGCRHCHHHRPVFDSTSCAICICDMDPADKKTLRCGHQFCNSCIVEWLGRSSTCPHCRQHVGKSTKLWAARIREEQNDTDGEWVPEDDHWQRLGNSMMARRRMRRRRVGVDTTRRNRLLAHVYTLYDRMLEMLV